MSSRGLAKAEKVYTVEEYLNFEKTNGNKHEYHQGKILASTGSSRHHNLIGSNITIAIGSRLRGHKCEIYVNDMRVKLTEQNYCYPDVVVIKGEPKFFGNEVDILENPTVVVEILSKSTLYHDKTEKLENYLSMKSVNECLLVKEDEMRIEHYAKQNAKQWMYRIYTENDEMISLESIACKITMSEVYAQVKF
jgi:Uma2 family endonuclease